MYPAWCRSEVSPLARPDASTASRRGDRRIHPSARLGRLVETTYCFTPNELDYGLFIINTCPSFRRSSR